jgi:hypothetical protein
MTMFPRTVLVIAALGVVLSEVGTRAQSSPLTVAPSSSLVQRLETSAQVYFSDAQSVMTWHPLAGAGLAHSTADEIFTTDTLCVFSTGPKNPAYGWRLNVTPLNEARGALTVRVDWQRSRDRTKIDDLPKTSVQVTLKPGDSIPLDYILAGPVPAGRTCEAVGMLLRIGLKAAGSDR